MPEKRFNLTANNAGPKGANMENKEYEGDESPTPAYPLCSVCGTETESTECWKCHGEGGFHDCGDDTCPCANPTIDNVCEECNGEGYYPECRNSQMPSHKSPVTVYDEARNANVCNLCGSADIEMGYGMAGGGGPGVYNFCNGCQRVLDKSPDSD